MMTNAICREACIGRKLDEVLLSKLDSGNKARQNKRTEVCIEMLPGSTSGKAT